MQIDLPDNVIAHANRLATQGEDAAIVISKAIDNLEWSRREVAAVQQGIDDHQAGRHRPLEEFGAEFMAKLMQG